MPNEQEDFLRDLNQSEATDVLDQPLTPEPEPVKDEAPQEDEESKYNRRERRLQAKLQAERESSIALAARLEALTEAQKFSREQNPIADETIARIYGTNTPEAAEATALLTKALANVETRSTERALEAFRAEQRQQQEAVRAQEQNLESMVEEIEDEVGVTMDKATQQGFFALLEKLSPKDREGNIVNYADHHAVWDEYQARKQQTAPNRAKDLASRTMVKTGGSPTTTVEADSHERFLRENGII